MGYGLMVKEPKNNLYSIPQILVSLLFLISYLMIMCVKICEEFKADKIRLLLSIRMKIVFIVF